MELTVIFTSARPKKDGSILCSLRFATYTDYGTMALLLGGVYGAARE